jgi:hypothetical protein
MELTTDQKIFLDVLEKTMGNVTLALEKTKYTREDFDEWMEDILFSIMIQEVNEKTIDYVENKLIQEINKGNLNAIQFYLKTKGKNRGYV